MLEVSVLLEMNAVCKSFGATRALDGVSLTVGAGEVRALIGENGAGKSTLMKVLSGALRPDAGSMTLDGEPYAPRGPRKALARGVAMIYQELALAPQLSRSRPTSCWARSGSGPGWIRLREHRRIAAEALELLEHPDIRPECEGPRPGRRGPATGRGRPGAGLAGPGHRLRRADELALRARCRAALRDHRPVEAVAGWRSSTSAISWRRSGGSRRRYTVLRDGRSVAEGSLADTDLRTIIGHMVGRDLGELFPRVPHAPGEPILELSDFRAGSRGRPANLVLRRGEILGLAGLVGAGRTRLVRAVFGLAPVVAGRVRVAHVDGGHATPRASGSTRGSASSARIARGRGWPWASRSRIT